MRKNYTSRYKAHAVLEVLREAEGLNEIAGRLEVHPNVLARWKKEAVLKLHTVYEDNNASEKREHEAQIQLLYAQIGELSSKLAWLKKNLASKFSRNERMKMLDKGDTDYTVKEQCELLSLNRTSLYYKPVPVSEKKLSIFRRIDEIFTISPAFGGATIGTVLRREGYSISDPTVRKYMTEMGLQAVYPGPNLSKRAHDSLIYPYLLRGIDIVRPDQVWGTDITYIRMNKGFMYLVAYMDWFSRYVLSWELSDTLEADFVVEALRRALATAIPEIVNSDQGSQYTSTGYTTLLTNNGVKISMDGRGRCMDNIFTERLWRSLKYQEVYLKEYQSPRDARSGIRQYFELYNTFRPHQGIGGLTPHEVYFGNPVYGQASLFF
jgi:putative transposase